MRSRVTSVVASALFLVLAPGTVSVYGPWLITGWEVGDAPPGLTAVRIVGLLVAFGAAAVLLDAFWRFAWIGRGSPAPVLPTESLVVSGLYRFVRNPMYLAVVSVIVGQAIWFWRWGLLAYGGAVLLAFDIFVRIYEEPTLRDQFGESYLQYCREVRRWIPRWHPWHPGP